MDKAQRARHLVTDDFFVEEIETLRQGCLQIFENSKADDYDVRESAYQKLKVINEIVSHFTAIADGQQMVAKRWKIL